MFFLTIVSDKFSTTIDDNMPTDTILFLKESINRHCSIPLNLIKLSYNGRPLEDRRKISEYEIQSYSRIDLELRLMEVNFLKTGTYNLKWFVENGVTVAELQRRIFGKVYGTIVGKENNYILKDGDYVDLA